MLRATYKIPISTTEFIYKQLLVEETLPWYFLQVVQETPMVSFHKSPAMMEWGFL